MMVPTPSEFAANWYFIINGESVMVPGDDPTLLALKQSLAGTIQSDSGVNVPQIVGGPDETAACRDTVNAVAQGSPEAAVAMGMDGLFKMWLACQAEAEGHYPVGYTQQVIQAVTAQVATKPWYMQPMYWALVGGAAVLGIVVMRRR